MLDIGAHHRRGGFRTQRERSCRRDPRRCTFPCRRCRCLRPRRARTAPSLRKSACGSRGSCRCGTPRARRLPRGSTTALAGGRISRVPLTARIIRLAASSLSLLCRARRSSATPFRKRACSSARHRAARLGGHAHHQHVAAELPFLREPARRRRPPTPRPIRAPFSTMAPMPIRLSSSIVQPCSDHRVAHASRDRRSSAETFVGVNARSLS